MRYLSLGEVLVIHRLVLAQSGGASGLRDFSALESAIAQPQMMYGGKELYEDIETKAAALCYSLVMNHPFVDGNKRIGHAAMETFLIMNGFELDAPVDESEDVILRLAAGQVLRSELVGWVVAHLTPRP
ncbi:MAG: type II toxin-antitoxin system death-on-curing family toxin [Maioricimonas sp. JB049]